MTRIIGLRGLDIRFPRSERLDGSDAMNPDPDRSAAHAIPQTGEPGLGGQAALAPGLGDEPRGTGTLHRFALHHA